MNAAIFSGRDVLWPPADELLESAERIRARLGTWPSTAAPWRLCLTPPELPRSGDIVVFETPDDPHAPRESSAPARARILGAGATVLMVDADGALLDTGTATYVLEGERSDDWLPALAAFLDCGFAAYDALCLALAWRDGDELDAPTWPVTLEHFPSVADAPRVAHRFAPCPAQLGLYPVVPNASWVERLVVLGVRTLQLRVKADPTAPAAAETARINDEIARAVRAAPRDSGVCLFINDHWRQALDAGAYGVHLGQEDLADANLDAIAAAGVRLGISTHGYYEMLRAWQLRPSYIALGPIFPTVTKVMSAPAQGLARLRQYVRLMAPHIPLVAIGGIDAEQLPAVLASGVGSAAVVRAVTLADPLEAAVAALQYAFTA